MSTQKRRASVTDDYKKLSRVIQCLRSCPALPLTLEEDSMTVPKWWIDASFAVQKDMKSQTGGILTTGKGAIYSASKKHTLNTKSSIEAEVVGVNDLMPVVCWTRYFLEGQGDDMKPSKIYQDNMSSILLEKNGKASSGKNARHITIRYFFITSRIRRSICHYYRFYAFLIIETCSYSYRTSSFIPSWHHCRW